MECKVLLKSGKNKGLPCGRVSCKIHGNEVLQERVVQEPVETYEETENDSEDNNSDLESEVEVNTIDHTIDNRYIITNKESKYIFKADPKVKNKEVEVRKVYDISFCNWIVNVIKSELYSEEENKKEETLDPLEILEKIDIIYKDTNKVYYPPKHLVLRALEHRDIKVVILGQDPYHTGTANGLAFSSNTLTPSLRNIYKEIERSFNEGKVCHRNPDLTKWSDQGVMLLNTALTVEEGNPGSHLHYWKNFISQEIKRLNNITKDIYIKPIEGSSIGGYYKVRSVIWLLWGKKAQLLYTRSVGHCISPNVILAPHPSPVAGFSGNSFVGSNCFVQCNKLLSYMNDTPIEWI